MLFDLTALDREYYAEHLADFLPDRLIDCHTHVWLQSFTRTESGSPRTASWPGRVAAENPIEDLLETYRLLFPGKRVTPLIFGYPSRGIDLDLTNGYVSQVARQVGLPALLVSTPEWSAEELARRMDVSGFLGLKPYLSFAPDAIPGDEITVYDFLPHAQLEVANQRGWIVMLHLPRRARLRDPLNLMHLLEIESRYPAIRLIVAHIGRAYCAEDVGDAFEQLKDTSRMLFDFSANTNARVMAQAIQTFGYQRILFGSDLPILRMRMRRICEQGRYINLVPPGLYGDISGDPHMREVSRDEGERLTFFMYEELAAFRQAAEQVGYTASGIEDVFWRNAARLLGLDHV